MEDRSTYHPFDGGGHSPYWFPVAGMFFFLNHVNIFRVLWGLFYATISTFWGCQWLNANTHGFNFPLMGL